MKLFTETFWNKGQSKNKRERNDKNNCLIGLLRGEFLDSKAKTRGIVLERFSGNSYSAYTHQKT